jgi:signal transduction histidine kinase
VTTEAASRAPAGEAGFRALAGHLPDLILLAFDRDLRIWSATGAALRARGWGPEDFLGKRVPDVGRPDDAAIVEAHCRAALVACEVTSELDGRLDPVVETALFRVAQQALANVVDHASATHAQVEIECSGASVVVRVSDDGCGFDPDHVQVLGDIAHFGLIAMRERVEALGGRFQVTTAPGQGMVAEARVPLRDQLERWGA